MTNRRPPNCPVLKRGRGLNGGISWLNKYIWNCIRLLNISLVAIPGETEIQETTTESSLSLSDSLHLSRELEGFQSPDRCPVQRSQGPGGLLPAPVPLRTDQQDPGLPQEIPPGEGECAGGRGAGYMPFYCLNAPGYFYLITFFNF